LGNPIEALLELAAEAVAVKEFFRVRVAALEELRYQGGPFEQTRAELLLYERGLDRAQKFLLDLAKLNLDERQAKLEESQVAMIGDAIIAGLTTILPPELQRDALAAASRYLLTIDASEPAPQVGGTSPPGRPSA
jgi:hypothetical protein